MRAALSAGELRALQRDPRTGEVGEISGRRKWIEAESTPPGLDTVVCAFTNPGPDAGELPVMLRCGAIPDMALASTLANGSETGSTRPPAKTGLVGR